MMFHRLRNNYRNRKNKWVSRSGDMFRSVFWALVAFEIVKLGAYKLIELYPLIYAYAETLL